MSKMGEAEFRKEVRRLPQIQYNFNLNDEYYTPPQAVEPIAKFIPNGATIWCPFDEENSNFVKVFKANGHDVINTHIFQGQDFFTIDIPKCEYIISNPPYSLKSQTFKKLYEIGKPFAMLVNLQGIFDCRERFELFAEKGCEVLWLYPRISYLNPDGTEKGRVPFQSGYVCHKILKTNMEFYFIRR